MKQFLLLVEGGDDPIVAGDSVHVYWREEIDAIYHAEMERD